MPEGCSFLCPSPHLKEWDRNMIYHEYFLMHPTKTEPNAFIIHHRGWWNVLPAGPHGGYGSLEKRDTMTAIPARFGYHEAKLAIQCYLVMIQGEANHWPYWLEKNIETIGQFWVLSIYLLGDQNLTPDPPPSSMWGWGYLGDWACARDQLGTSWPTPCVSTIFASLVSKMGGIVKRFWEKGRLCYFYTS